MKKEPRVFFVIDGKRVEKLPKELAEKMSMELCAAFTEYFGNAYDEWLGIVKEYSELCNGNG